MARLNRRAHQVQGYLKSFNWSGLIDVWRSASKLAQSVIPEGLLTHRRLH